MSMRFASLRLLRATFIIGSILVLPAQTHAQELLLGYLTAGSGNFATISKTNAIAAQMAVDGINKAGGVKGKKLRLVAFDTAGKPDQAVVGLRSLADDSKVLAIIGPFSSSECRVVFPAGERIGIASMSMASSAPKLAEPFTYAFRNTTDESVMFAGVMRALEEMNLPRATASVAYATDDVVSKALGEIVLPGTLKKSNVDLKASVTFQGQAFDLAPQASQLISTPTDLIAVGSAPEPAVRLIKALRRLGSSARVVTGSTVADPDLPRLLGKDGDGTIIPSSFYADLSDRTRQFESDFLKQVRVVDPERSASSQFDAATYDIVMIYAAAIAAANVTGDPQNLAAERQAIRDQVRKLSDFPGLEGSLSFGANGDALKPVYVAELKNGKWLLLKSYVPSK